MGFIDQKGNVIVQPIYDEAEFFSEGFARVSLNGNFKYLNLKGEVVIELDHTKSPYGAKH